MTKVHTACNSHVTVGHGVGEQLRNGRQLWVVGYEERQRLDPLGLVWHGDEKRDQNRHVVAEAHNAQRGQLSHHVHKCAVRNRCSVDSGCAAPKLVKNHEAGLSRLSHNA